MTFDITFFSAVSVGIPLLIGLSRLSGLDKVGVLLFSYVCLSVMTEVVMRVLFEYSINNHFIFHVHSYIQFGMFSLVLYHSRSSNSYKRLVLILSGVFSIFSTLNISLWESLSEFNSNQRYVGGILLIFLLITSLIQFKRRAEKNLRFLASSLLLYFISTLTVFILGKELFQGDEVNYSWIVHALLNIALNLCFAVFLFRNHR